MAVHEGKPLEVEALCNQAIQLSLQQWQTLPPLPGAVHIPLLQTFQQLVLTNHPTSIKNKMHVLIMVSWWL